MPETTTQDRVAAYLEEVRADADDEAAGLTAERDVPRLLAALEAVLAQHQPGRIAVLGALCSRHKDHRYFSITSTEAADVTACPDCAATVYVSCEGCGLPMRLDSCPARAAISRELSGEVPGA